MNSKELATEFYGMAHDAAMNTMDIIQQESTCRMGMEHSYQKTGIRIDFMFRNEVDYSLLVPWEYVQDDDKLRDYYKRFLVLSKEARTIPDVDRIAEVFSDQELNNLQGK
jgi:hypothetical protein